MNRKTLSPESASTRGLSGKPESASIRGLSGKPESPAFRLIGQMAYTYNADIGIAYSSPCRGVWNIVHYGTLVPGGHQVYVCPTSCLRGVVLTTAEMGAMEKLSTITVGEDNLLDGDMEEELLRGTEKIIDSLPEHPRLMMIFTSCIHHFLAVNYQRVYRILRKEYPDIDFIDCYMDPIMRRQKPPFPNLVRQVTRVLPQAEKNPRQANFLGNCFPMAEDCDLYCHLREHGIRVLDLPSMKTYEEFLGQAASPVNFTFHGVGAAAAKDLEIRLGQAWKPMRNGYDYDAIDEDMAEASALLGIPAPSGEEIRRQRRETEQAAEALRKALAGTAISLDDTAVDRPLELALYLLDHGFSVESVFLESITEPREVFERLREKKTDLKVYSALGWNMRRVRREHSGKLLAVGQKSAYFAGCGYFVNMTQNDGLYGYRGIRRLFRLMAEAAVEEKPLRELVQQKGWRAGPYFTDICARERQTEQEERA